MIGLGIGVNLGGAPASLAAQLASAFSTRVIADGGTVESSACLKADLNYLTSNP